MKPMLDGINTSIRLTVVGVCLIATLLTAGLATGLQYYFGKTMAREAASNLYATAAAGVAGELHSVGRVNTNVIGLLADNTRLLDLDRRAEHLETLTDVLEKNPLYYSAYIGNGKGYLFEVINLESSTLAREILGASAEDRWLHIRVEPRPEGNLRHFHYLDNNLTERDYRNEQTDYVVTSRPWYRDAIVSDESTTTAPYIFAQTGIPGRTFSQRITGSDTVVGIDMTMAAISRFLRESRVAGQGQVYLFNAGGQVMGSSLGSSQAHSTRASQDTPDQFTTQSRQLPGSALQRLAAQPALHGQLVETDRQEQAYFAYVQPVGANNNDIFMGVLSPRNIVIAPYLDKVKLSIGATTLFLLLLLPLSWVIANPIVKPIKQLARENHKVQRREYDKVNRVTTHVQELAELSDSMVDMVAAIQAHELAQRELMDSIIKVIAEAIDDKSSYTGGHCERVPELALMLAQSASDSKLPAFSAFKLQTDDQWREYQIAAWLHDCGKITTPEHIVDKGSKLETIYNRIHEVRMRFEVLWRDAEIQYLKQRASSPDREQELLAALQEKQSSLQDDFAFVAECNVGGEFLDQEKIDRLCDLGNRSWQRYFSNRLGLSPLEELRLPATNETLPAEERLLSDKSEHVMAREQSINYPAELAIDMEVPEHLANLGELYNLSISRGTLTDEDRFRINEHMISTIKMLERLPFPKELSNVPRYASTHHETMKGTGYPRRLPGDALSIPERILAIADIFEALTASDRPYKKAKSLSIAVDIMHKMVLDNHIDRDCFELFLTSGTYLNYAQTFLAEAQIDHVDIDQYVTKVKPQNRTG